jgi:uncharacterized protein (DUF427 family)
MSNRAIKIPGPDHPITIENNPNRVIVTLGRRTIADTTGALTLREAHYPPVQYIPRKDVDMAALEPSETASYCPYKGDAAYFSVSVDGTRSVDAVWSYVEPFDAVAGIREYLAFYPDRVDAIREQVA